MDQFTLTIDQNLLDCYNNYYFSLYPRRRKPPINRPIHESLNTWSMMQRIAKNALKQNWKEFIKWWISNDPMLCKLHIKRCSLTFTSFMPSRRRADPDNMVPKFILDGFVESGLLADDDSSHLESLTLACSYDKERPRTEIEFTVYEYEQIKETK